MEPSKTELSFESDYFSSVYRQSYFKRNPKRKIDFYLDTALKYKTSGNLFDVGCAYGLFCKAASNHFKCTGCDISVHAIEQAKRLFSSPELHYFVSNLPNITLKKTFDVVSCFDVLEHVPDLDLAFVSLKSLLLDSSSILLFTVPVYDGMMGRIVNILDNDPTHIHKKSRYFWKDMLIKHGLEVVETIGVFRYFLMNKIYLHFGNPPLWPVAPAILMVARRNYAERT